MVECNLQRWLARGRQRLAVVAVFRGVLTGAQLWREAAKLAPKIQLRDVRAILREFEARGLSRCLNPTATSGRLFEPTPAGIHAFQALSPQSSGVPVQFNALEDLPLASLLLRARVRLAVFRELLRDDFAISRPKSAAEVKRTLRATCPLTLNQTSRAINELQRAGLIEAVDPDEHRRRFRPTALGLRVAQELHEPYSQQQSPDPKRNTSDRCG
jgi:hypothetical protein